MTPAVYGSMVVSTTSAIEGRPVQWYLGIVAGDVLVGGDSLREAMGETSGVSEAGSPCCAGRTRAIDLGGARDQALGAMLREAAERGANAVLGVGFAYEPIDLAGRGFGLVVTASGTAVRV